ncbi:pitrilysin family protein [Synechococcus sp. RS9916]|uniref:M16 family metallopeptidase n=1 Tax=Synechococcus sp. RS9916 TaxID=221359 RepID=UPI0000E5402B|nr:pitrilysin family protein [Synechococcus sp. RS9916]EAU73652.1 Insulinase family (Peptidase family M16) [Synechococcus sp. RS9916]
MNPASELILDPHTTAGVLAAKLWIRRGSACDPHQQRGAHQLLGSLLSRGCGPYGPMELADLVEGSGAGLRCDTNEDGLLISLKCRDNDAERLLPVIGWMVHQPHLLPDQVELEKELSLQALVRQKEDPFHLAYDGWRTLAYGSGGYGHDPLGVTGDLDKLERDQLVALAKQLDGASSVLAMSGTIPKALLNLLNDHEAFQSQAASSATDNGIQDQATVSSEDRPQSLCLRVQNTEQVVMMLGQPSLPHGHADDPALRLLQTHLGQGMSSLLFRRLREEHGVAYDVGVHYPARAEASPFVFHAATSVDKASLSLSLLHESWNELCSTPLSEADLQLARVKVRGQLAHGSQTTGQRAERRAQLRGLGLPDDYDQRSLAVMDALDANAVQDAAQRHLGHPLLSLCGPETSLRALGDQWEQKQERQRPIPHQQD